MQWRVRDRLLNSQTHREYLDFQVDGVSLLDRCRAVSTVRQINLGTVRPPLAPGPEINSRSTDEAAEAIVLDVVGFLGWLPTHEETELLDQLLSKKPPTLESGRAMLYVCAECGVDIGCGAITALIEAANDEVIWSDLGFEKDWCFDDDDPLINREGYENIAPFTSTRSNTARHC